MQALGSLYEMPDAGKDRNTPVNGGYRPNSSMSSFGDRLASVEIDVLVDFIRAWEPKRYSITLWRVMPKWRESYCYPRPGRQEFVLWYKIAPKADEMLHPIIMPLRGTVAEELHH